MGIRRTKENQQDMDSHYEDETVFRPSDLYDGIFVMIRSHPYIKSAPDYNVNWSRFALVNQIWAMFEVNSRRSQPCVNAYATSSMCMMGLLLAFVDIGR